MKLKVSAAAKILGVSSSTVVSWENKRLITSEKTPGGHRLFDKEEILQFKERYTNDPSIIHNEKIKAGEVAKIMGAKTRSAVDYWVEKGLITSERTPGGQRLFDKETILRLKQSIESDPNILKKRNFKLSETAKANIREGIRKNRYTEEYAKKLSVTKQGTKNPFARLTEAEVVVIRELFATGKWSHQALAERYNVARTTISDILHRRTWKHL